MCGKILQMYKKKSLEIVFKDRQIHRNYFQNHIGTDALAVSHCFELLEIIQPLLQQCDAGKAVFPHLLIILL